MWLLLHLFRDVVIFQYGDSQKRILKCFKPQMLFAGGFILNWCNDVSCISLMSFCVLDCRVTDLKAKHKAGITQNLLLKPCRLVLLGKEGKIRPILRHLLPKKVT